MIITYLEEFEEINEYTLASRYLFPLDFIELALTTEPIKSKILSINHYENESRN